MVIYHIVLVKYTLGATIAQKNAWVESIVALQSSIPQIKELISGQKLPHVKDGGWDDGVIMKFDNETDLQTYADAKPHKDYQQATAAQTAGTVLYKDSIQELKQRCQDKLIFDIQT